MVTKELYEKYYKTLKNGNHGDGVDLEIKTICFLNILNGNQILIDDLDLSNHEVFNKVMEREFSKQNDVKVKDLLGEIIKTGVFNHRAELNIVNKDISLLDNTTRKELFNYETLDTGRDSHWTTSDNIIDLITKLIDISHFETILDLCSGKGIFLNKCSEINPKAILTGYEINQIANVVAKMRLFINGANLELHRENILEISLNTQYDLVFSDYPWSLRTARDVVDDKNMIVSYERNRMKADWNFIFKAINSMKHNGKAIAIVPQGALFNTLDKSSRKQVIDNELLEQVIKLPAGTYPGTGVQYSIVVFSYGNKSVKLVDATECLVGKNSGDKKIDINKFVDLIQSEDDSKIIEVSTSQIIKADYNFEVGRYLSSVMNLNIINPRPIKEIGTVLSGYQYTSKSLKEVDPGIGNVDIVKIINIIEGEIDYSSLASTDIDAERIEKYLLKENDILISSKGTAIKLALVTNLGDRKVIPHNNLMVIRVTSEEVLPAYLCCFLNSDSGRLILNSLQTGSIIINITKSNLLELNIPVIDMDTQETIVNRYNILKKEIVKLKSRLNVLEEKIMSVYDDEVGE